jgi:3-methyladenine DNA glycosylase/8-oxoguanine DNA glycosylase
VGDLGLIKLLSALRGEWVDAAETAELLEPYGEWAGLASIYLLAGFERGLVPLGAKRAA